MSVARPSKLGPRAVATAVLAAALAAPGCQSYGKFKENTYKSMRSVITSSYQDPEADAKMAKAEQLHAAGEFKDAAEIFDDIADNTYNPVLMAEKARFFEAECLQKQNKLSAAAATYNRLLNDHPLGVYRERACARIYEIAYSWLERDTLAEIEASQKENKAGKAAPWWEKKATGVNISDKSRPTFDTEGEALRYMESVHVHDNTGPYADKALFWAGYVNFYRGRFEEADSFFTQLIDMHKDSKLLDAAIKMAIMSKNNSTGGAVYDSQKAAEALQLVHYAEASMPGYTSDKEKTALMTRQKLAVRMQLAEKDYKTAEYYERTHHPASAYFYYVLVCRRYPGTKFSDLAKARIAELEKVRVKMEDEAANPKPPGTFDSVRRELDRIVGKPVVEPITPDAATGPTPPAPPPQGGAQPQAWGNAGTMGR